MRKVIPGLLIALLLFFGVSFALAQEHYDIHDKDGDDWLTWGPQMKIAFVEGFKSGTDFVMDNNENFLNFPLPEKYDVKKAEKVRDDFYKANKLYALETTFGSKDVALLMTHVRAERRKLMADLSVTDIATEKIVEGLDGLYGNYENRDIKLHDAVYYVKKKLGNTPAEDLKRMLNFLKSGKERTDFLIIYNEKNEAQRFIPFP